MKKLILTNKLSSFSSLFMERLKTMRWKSWSIYCFLLFSVGAFINTITEFIFPHFFAHQFLLIAATTLLVCALKSFFCDLQALGGKSSDSLLLKVPEVRGLYEKQLLPKQKGPWIFLAAFLVALFFFSCIVLVEYIKIDIIGIYAIYIAGSSVMLGTYAYVQYLLFMRFIYQIGNCQLDHRAYNVLTPAETAWIKKIAKMAQELRNYFLCVALLYTVEYSILIPTDKIELSDKGVLLNTPNNTAFILSWIAFFLLVIIAFPVINYAQHKLVVRVVDRLKSQTIKELSVLMFEDHRDLKDRRARMYSVISYHSLIENVRQSRSYPINRQLSYETLMTFITFVVHIMNLFSKIQSIPHLAAPLT